jgi:hypothetical protein
MERLSTPDKVGVAGISVATESVPATIVATWSASDMEFGCGVLFMQAVKKAIPIRTENFFTLFFLRCL